RRQSRRRPVVRESLVQRVAGRVDNVARRIKVRFADLEMDDIVALGLERARLHQHFKRRLGPEPRHSFRQTEWTRGSLMHDADYSAPTPFVLSTRGVTSLPFRTVEM